MPTQTTGFRGRPLAFLALAGGLAAAGCGNGERVVPVSGTVTRNGQPVPGLVVSFVPEAATQTGVSTGETDDAGRYTLTVVKGGGSGAVAGRHKVWVSVPREPYVEKGADDDKAKAARAKGRRPKPPADVADILKVYGRLDSSPLAVEVGDGSPIDLKLD